VLRRLQHVLIFAGNTEKLGLVRTGCLQLLELADPVLDNFAKSFHFLRRISSSAERIANLVR